MPGGLKALRDFIAKPVQRADEFRKFKRIKVGPCVTAPIHIRQLPLPGTTGDLPTDVTFDSRPRENDLGAILVCEDIVEDTRVVVVKVAKSIQAFFVANLLQQAHRRLVTLALCKAEQLLGTGITYEMGVERLTMTTHPLQRVEVRFKEIRPRAHLCENDKCLETVRHGLAYQIGFGRFLLPVWASAGIDGEITHQVRMHSLVLQVL